MGTVSVWDGVGTSNDEGKRALVHEFMRLFARGATAE